MSAIFKINIEIKVFYCIRGKDSMEFTLDKTGMKKSRCIPGTQATRMRKKGVALVPKPGPGF